MSEKLIDERKKFERKLTELRNSQGEKVALRFLQTTIEVANWLKYSGHGELTLSAKNSVLANKMNAREIVPVYEN